MESYKNADVLIVGSGIAGLSVALRLPDNKKVTETYGWKPKNDINNIVRDIYEWMSRDKVQLKKFL